MTGFLSVQTRYPFCRSIEHVRDFIFAIGQRSEIRTSSSAKIFLLSAKESLCILHYEMEFGRRNSWGDGIKMRDIIPSHLFRIVLRN